MTTTSDLDSLFWLFLPRLPIYLVWLLGIILCVLYWHKYPAVCLMTCLALVALLGSGVVSTYLFGYWITRARIERGWSDAQSSNFMSVANLIVTGIQTGAWIILLVALFGWRQQRRPGRPWDEPQRVRRPD